MNSQLGYYVEGKATRARQPVATNKLFSRLRVITSSAMRIPLIAGRTFNDRDNQQSPRVAIVSAELVQRVFPGENPIGRRINVTTGPENFREIVGVVGDVTQQGLVRGSSPHVYEPFSQAPSNFMTLIVRGSSDPTALVPAIRSKVLELDHELPLQRVTTLDKIICELDQAATFHLGCAFGVCGQSPSCSRWPDFTESFRMPSRSVRESLAFVSRSVRRSATFCDSFSNRE